MCCNIIRSHIHENPLQEFRKQPDRVGLSEGSSIKGRVVSALAVPYHVGGIVVKPLLYLFLGSCLQKNKEAHRRRVETTCMQRLYQAGRVHLLGPVCALLGQVIKVIRAALGIFHPGFYFENVYQKDYDAITLESPFKEIIEEAEKFNVNFLDRFKIKSALSHQSYNFTLLAHFFKTLSSEAKKGFIQGFAQGCSNFWKTCDVEDGLSDLQTKDVNELVCRWLPIDNALTILLRHFSYHTENKGDEELGKKSLASLWRYPSNDPFWESDEGKIFKKHYTRKAFEEYVNAACTNAKCPHKAQKILAVVPANTFPS